MATMAAFSILQAVTSPEDATALSIIFTLARSASAFGQIHFVAAILECGGRSRSRSVVRVTPESAPRSSRRSAASSGSPGPRPAVSCKALETRAPQLTRGSERGENDVGAGEGRTEGCRVGDPGHVEESGSANAGPRQGKGHGVSSCASA